VHATGRTFEIAGLKDAADLLDQPDFARRFVEDDVAPYGLELWPASVMLAEHILCGEEGNGKRAIELGCGLGLVAIAAALKGWQVTATDNDPTSLRFAQYNAAVNGADIASFEPLDWHDPPTERCFDRVFGADLLYQATDHAPILRCIHGLLAGGGTALLADPHRGVADGFESKARDQSFDVHLIPTAATIGGRQVRGRLFLLRRGVLDV
jgi:predicted nicotinamide N-methyase